MDEYAIAMAIIDILKQQGLWPEVREWTKPAVEWEPGQISTDTAKARYELESSVSGLAVLNNRLENLATDVQSTYTGILAAMALQYEGVVPPVWYTAPTTPPATGDIASAVWSFRATLEDDIAWNHLMFLENFAKNIGRLAAFPLQGDPFLMVETSWKYPPD